MVSRSASACIGWARSDSMLTTGTGETAAIRSTTCVIEDPGREDRVVAGEDAGHVLDRLARVDAHLLALR